MSMIPPPGDPSKPRRKVKQSTLSGGLLALTQKLLSGPSLINLPSCRVAANQISPDRPNLVTLNTLLSPFSRLEIIGVGFDALILLFKVCWLYSNPRRERLFSRHCRAMLLGGYDFAVSTGSPKHWNGHPNMRCYLAHGGLLIGLSRFASLTHFNIAVQARGKACTEMGVHTIYRLVLAIIKELGGEIEDEVASLCDIRIDLLNVKVDPFAQAVLAHRVATPILRRNRPVTDRDGHFDVMIGTATSAAQLCLYDKVREATKNPLDLEWVVANCWKGIRHDCVTRLEFHVRREMLSREGINSFSDLLRRLPYLIRTLMDDFCRFTETPAVGKHAAKTLPIWEQIKEAMVRWAKQPYRSIPAVQRLPDLSALAENSVRAGFGSFIFAAAAMGVKVHDPQSLAKFINSMMTLAPPNIREDMRSKCAQHGIPDPMQPTPVSQIKSA